MPVVVAPILIPMLALLLCLFLWAASRAGQTFFRPLFEALSSTVGRLPIVGGLVGHGIDWLIHHTLQPISRWALNLGDPVVAFFLHLAGVVESWAFSGFYTAARMLHALHVLRGVTLPRLLRAVGGVAVSLPRVIRISVREAHHAETISAKALRRAVAVTIPRDLRWVGRRAGEAEALAERALRGLRDVRNLLAAGVGAAIVARALGRLGVGNNRCGNVKKFERQVCGAHPELLDALLGGLALVIGTVSLIEFARACQTVEGEIIDGVHSFLRP